MPLRLSAGWMTICDDRVLEYLESEGPNSPKHISDDGRVRFGQQYINRRLLILSDADLVKGDVGGRGVYALTDEGESYLGGELDAADLETPEE